MAQPAPVSRDQLLLLKASSESLTLPKSREFSWGLFPAMAHWWWRQNPKQGPSPELLPWVCPFPSIPSAGEQCRAPGSSSPIKHLRTDVPGPAKSSSGEPKGHWAPSTSSRGFLNPVPNSAFPINVNGPIEFTWTACGNMDRKVWLCFGKLNFRKSEYTITKPLKPASIMKGAYFITKSIYEYKHGVIWLKYGYCPLEILHLHPTKCHQQASLKEAGSMLPLDAPAVNQEISWSLPGTVESSQNCMKCYLCAISCGVGAGRSVGRKKGKKENHFLNSSYNVWKTFIHSIHLSGFHVITPGKKIKKKF